jgi:hypothetical protein
MLVARSFYLTVEENEAEGVEGVVEEPSLFAGVEGFVKEPGEGVFGV